MPPYLTDSGRLVLFWDSPIPAALFLAMLWPWGLLFNELFAARSGLRILVCAAWDIVLPCMIALTQSRGPILAFAASMIATAVAARWFSKRLFGRLWGRFAVVLVVLVVIGGYSGARTRFSAGLLNHDRSVLNRRAIWACSGVMLAQNPFAGIGSGESGYFYSQWYQGAATDYLYRGVFNDYLQAGIEQGLPCLFVMSWFALTLACLIFFKPKNATPAGCWAPLSIAAYGSVFAAIIAATTSSFAGYPSIIIMALVGGGVLVVSIALHVPWPRIGFGMLLSLCLAAGIAAFAFDFNKKPQNGGLSVVWKPDHTVLLIKSLSPAEGKRATILVDRSVNGPVYGQELRQMLDASEKTSEFLVCDPRFPVTDGIINGAETLVLMGRSCRYASRVDSKKVRRVVFIHPALVPRSIPLQSEITIMLPDHDETDCAQEWLQLRGQRNITICRTSAQGQYLPGAKAGLGRPSQS